MARQPDKQLRVEILLEAVESKFQTVAEGHSLLTQQIDRVDQKVDHLRETLEQKLDMVIEQVGGLTQHVSGLEQWTMAHDRAHHN